jgi:DNA-binding transcriptional LysR family regulator
LIYNYARRGRNSILAGLVAARSGWGLLRLLSYQIAPDIHAGRLQTVLHEYAPPPYPVNLLNVQGRQSSAKVRTFIDFATERLRANTLLNSKAPLSARATIDTV